MTRAPSAAPRDLPPWMWGTPMREKKRRRRCRPGRRQIPLRMPWRPGRRGSHGRRRNGRGPARPA
eukprot:6662840-Prorocentrum_lima.AAC.1